MEALLKGCLEREGSYWDAVRDDAAAVEHLRSDVLREAVPVLRGLRSGQVPPTAVDPLRSLLEAGVIEPAEPPRGASRRHRYYRATERPSQPPEHVVEAARQGIAGLRAWCGETEFKALLGRLAAEAR